MNKELELQTKNGVRVINQASLTVIAEVGNQFNGDYDTAIRLAKAAKDAGADAVKYIFWFPDEIMADKTQLYKYHISNEFCLDGVTIEKKEPMFDLLDRLRLTPYEWQDVKNYCDKIDIMMMSTVNCWGAYQLALDLTLPAIKLSSWDYNFTDLWRWCAKTMLPCIADVGPVTEEEMDRNVNLFNEERNRELMFLQCFHATNYEQMNMLNIPYLSKRYDCLVGYSASGRDDYLDALSIGLGGCVLEKRLTLDRKGGMLHDAVSKEPDEFKEYVDTMRKLKHSLGNEQLHMSDNDWAERKKWFRRVVADEFIPKGTLILREMLECKRGETGLSPERLWDLVSKVANRDIAKNEDISLEDVE